MGCIEPKTLILLQDGKLRHHIVFTSLAFQHRHPQRVQMPPSGFQTAAVMAVVGELVGIGAATMAPCQSIGRAWLLIRRGCGLRASELGRDFLLQKRAFAPGHPVDDERLASGFEWPGESLDAPLPLALLEKTLYSYC